MAADPAPPEAGPTPVAVPRGAVEVGAALGGGVWWAERVFEVAGGWAPTAAEAAVRVHLAELSRVVGEHAVALRRHLPRPTGVDPDTWVRGRAGADDVVAAIAAPTGSPERLAGLHRALLPRLVVAWTAHRDGAALADRGIARSLGHAVADLSAAGVDGEALLQALIGTDPSLARSAATAAGEVEAALVVTGGLLPDPPVRMPGAAP